MKYYREADFVKKKKHLACVHVLATFFFHSC